MTQSPQPHAQPLSDDEIDLGHLLRTLWRGKYWILICGIIGLAFGTYYIRYNTTPLYTAAANVTFESRKTQSMGGIDSVAGDLRGDRVTINTEIEVLRSRGLLTKLATRLNLVEDPEFNGRLRTTSQFSIAGLRAALRQLIKGPPPERPAPSEKVVLDSVVSALAGRIGITNLRSTLVLRISVTTQNPRKSAMIANTLAELYILDQLEVKFEATEKATAWLTDRVSQLQNELEVAVEAVKDFNASSQLGSVEELALLNRQLKDVRDRAKDAADTLTLAQQQVANLTAAQATNDLQQMAELASDRSLTRILDLITSGAANDDTAFQARYAQILDRAQLEIQRTQAQSAAFATSISELEQQIATQSTDLVKLQQLEREAEASRLIYEFFLGRLKETSVQQGIQQADSRILSNAIAPGGASSPRKNRIRGIALFLGLALGTGLVLLRELTQNTIRTPEELEKLTGQTVLGQIPIIPARSRSNVLKYLTEKPTSAAAEAVRNLRTSTLLSNIDNPPQIIMSTSSLPEEGKTTQSISLAQNLSGLGKKVLLIEGDIRRRVFAEYFDIKGKDGLLAVLSGKATIEDVVVYNEQLGADILVGEKSKVNAADVFSSDTFKAFLTEIRDLYDYIIIDTPPVLIVPDARVIGQHVDAILYTVKWDHTTKRQVSEGLKSFASVNLYVTGLVLGQINAKGMKRYGYGDGYGAYGKYGRGYYDN